MNQTVIDVSSDEEDDKLVKRSDCVEQVSKILYEKPKSNGHHKSIWSDNPPVEDDDCVVLDDDPYKTTEKDNAIDTCVETGDEVIVVSQKGEIACRDFPHPRHACAKYPFKSTSHQMYCEMCHCYVCDTPAPCLNWCIGSNIDHCHANDKERIWKFQRECLRTGKKLPFPVSKPSLARPQIQQVSQPHSVPLPQNSSSLINEFGIRSCYTSTRVVTHPNTYTRPGYRTEPSRNYPQIPSLQPSTAVNHRGGSYNGNPNPLAVSSNPFKWTRRPSRSVYCPENVQANIPKASQYTWNAPPKALPGNPQQITTGHISTVPESHSKMYASRNMHVGNVLTNEVPSVTSKPPANQQQQQHQSGISPHSKVLSEFEAWLMDNTTLTDSVFPLFGQDNNTSTFDFESFLG